VGGAGARLGIDLGTYHTVAVLALPGREPRPVLFDGSPLLRSAVCAETGNRLLVGQDALHTGLSFPESLEPYPKRCVDDGTVLLGGREISVSELFGAPLGRVVAEVRLITDQPVTEAVLTCPAAWGARRRATLLAAARRVLPSVRLVPEPVAATHYFVEVAGRRLPVGGSALVYDLGAGTFDVTVVRRTEAGFEVLATEGLADHGGLDIDAAVVSRLGESVGVRDAALWQRLTAPATPGDRRANQQLWTNVRAGKEMLSRASRTMVHVPLFDLDVPLGREELEQVAAPVLDRTVRVARGVLDRAGTPDSLAAILLVGGASRMPAVATALHREFGLAPSVVDQPELVVAEGSLRVPETGVAPVPVPVTSTTPAEATTPGSAAATATTVERPTTAVAPATARALAGAPTAPRVSGPTGAAGAGVGPTDGAGTAGVPNGMGTAGGTVDGTEPAGGVATDAAGGRPAAAGSRSAARLAAWWSRWSRMASVAGAAIGVLGLIVATAVVVSAQGGDRGNLAGSPGEGPSGATLGNVSPSPTPTPTPTSVNGVDSCMIGTWRSVAQQSFNYIDGRKVQFTGRKGVVQTYTPDGKVKLDFDKSTDSYATVGGVRWRSRIRGTATANVYHRDGFEYISGVRAKGTMDLYRGSSRNNREPLQLLLEPIEYICDGDTMRIFGNGVTEYERVR